MKTKPKSTKKYDNVQSSTKTKSFMSEMRKKAKKDAQKGEVMVVVEPKKAGNDAELNSIAGMLDLLQEKVKGRFYIKSPYSLLMRMIR